MSRFTISGRLVQGDPQTAQPQRKDDRTGALKFRKDGQPDCPFYVAVAVDKNPANRFVVQGVPTWEETKQLLDNDARSAWPQYFGGQRPGGLQFGAELPADCTNPKFANKIIDGDGFDDKGQAFSRNEGWAGAWIVKCQNGYAPKIWVWANGEPDPRGVSQTGWIEASVLGRKIKCGDYVTVSGTCESNKSDQTAGMYMNFDTVSFEKEGDLIVSSAGVDPNQALGARGPNAAPAATSSAPAPSTPASPTASAPAYSGYRETAGAPDAPAAPPAGPVMTAKAAGVTFEQFLAKGWTEETLRAHGYVQ